MQQETPETAWRRLTSGGGREAFNDLNSRARKMAEREFYKLAPAIEDGEMDYSTAARVAVERTERALEFEHMRQLRNQHGKGK